MKPFLTIFGSIYVVLGVPYIEYRHSLGHRATFQVVIASIGIVMLLIAAGMKESK